MKVDFFLIGAQKGGTTTLHSKLSQVSGLQMSCPKEIHFFDDETIHWDRADYTGLHSRFDWRDANVRRGEATPIYCYWPESLRRIHAYNPDARLIMLMRHPAHRALSHWRMECERGFECLPFAEAISANGRSRVALARGGAHRTYSYVERGFYSCQVARVKELFPDCRVLFLRTDELWLKPEETLERVTRFLGVAPPDDVPPGPDAPLNGDLCVPPTQEGLTDAILYLTKLYTADIQETERLTGLSLSDWLNPSYREPMSQS